MLASYKFYQLQHFQIIGKCQKWFGHLTLKVPAKHCIQHVFGKRCQQHIFVKIID